jgi:hypothetical protein
MQCLQTCSGVGWLWLGQAYKALLLVQHNCLLRSCTGLELKECVLGMYDVVHSTYAP